MKFTFYINAKNISSGGGKILLLALLRALPTHVKTIILLDSRLRNLVDLPETVVVRTIRPTILERLCAEWWLKKTIKKGDLLLSFGSLPMLFKCKGLQYLFIQNKYLIDNEPLNNFDLKTHLRLSIERYWLRLRGASVDRFFVQTIEMSEFLQVAGFYAFQPIHVTPFIGGRPDPLPTITNHPFDSLKALKEKSFIYPASGEPHKNHKNLINAWIILAEEKLFPVLRLTIDHNSSPELCNWINNKIRLHSLRVENLGTIPQELMTEKYLESDAVIFPSTFESFGMPLVEASNLSVPILASESNYVRDICSPNQTFCPQQSKSIARAVKRFLGVAEERVPILDASGFLNIIFKI